MTSSQRVLGTAVAALCLTLGSAGCSQPEKNAEIRITGDREKAVPTTEETTTTTTSTTTTTLFFADR